MTTLVIGYGNSLCGDDGLGPFVAGAAGRRLAGVQTRIVAQLLPELAEELAAAEAVVFVDARIGGERLDGPTVEVREATASGEAAAFTHAATPEALLGLAATLYGHAPQAWIVSVRGQRFELGAGLSPAARRNAEIAVSRIVDLVADQSSRARKDRPLAVQEER